MLIIIILLLLYYADLKRLPRASLQSMLVPLHRENNKYGYWLLLLVSVTKLLFTLFHSYESGNVRNSRPAGICESYDFGFS